MPALSGLLPDAICFLSLFVYKFEGTGQYRAVPRITSIRQYFNGKNTEMISRFYVDCR